MIISFFYTLWCRFLLLILMIIFFIPFIIFIALPDHIRYKNKIAFYLVDIFYKAVLKGSLLPITYKGFNNIPSGPVIFVANHQSSLDVALLGIVAQKKPHIWMALSNLMDSPILRFILPRLSVLVDISSPRKAVESLQNTYELVHDKDCHVMIFPEGGRYVDGVHEFFRGFAILAKKLNRPVIPVYIYGVNKVYPPNRFLIHWDKIIVTIGEPFFIKEHESDREFRDRIYDWFLAQQKAGNS